MLKLFQSFFTSETTRGKYPDPLIREAIERAVDGTDPSLRGLLRYKNKMREPVLRAIDHVVELVDGLDVPIEASRARFGDNPLLRNYFVSADQMESFFRQQLATAANQHESSDGKRVVGLLVMDKEEKNILGADLVGDIVVRDVPQVTVSFSGHRLLDPTENENETRRFLKRRAFDHLLSLALGRISAISDVGVGLQRHRDLLQAKLDALQRGSWGFDFLTTHKSTDVAQIESEISRIDEELPGLGLGADNLQVSLNAVNEVLGQPEAYLWAERSHVVIDRMGVKREKSDSNASELELQVIRNAAGRSVVVSLVRVRV